MWAMCHLSVCRVRCWRAKIPGVSEGGTSVLPNLDGLLESLWIVLSLMPTKFSILCLSLWVCAAALLGCPVNK